MNSPTYISGITGYGSALTLSGSIGQCITVTPYLNINYRSFTWEFWIYPTTTNLSAVTLIGQCSDNIVADKCLTVNIINNSMSFGFGSDDVAGSTLISANSWSHMAFVYDSTGNKKFIYLNGILEGTQNSSGSLQVTSTMLTFGCQTINNGSSYRNHFSGYIDQMLYTSRIKSVNEILDDASLVFYYRFLSSDLLIDSGPNNINGTLGGGAVSISSGVVNQAINLPTNESYFLLTGLVLLGTSDWPFSLSLWCKRNSSNDNLAIRVSSTITGGGGWCPLLIGVDSYGTLSMFFRVRVSLGQSITGPTIPIGVWTHIVYTFSTTNGVRVYANGTLYSTTSVPSFYSNGVPKVLIIGELGTGPICGYSASGQTYGSVDEFRLYSREITGSEVAQLYSNP